MLFSIGTELKHVLFSSTLMQHMNKSPLNLWIVLFNRFLVVMRLVTELVTLGRSISYTRECPPSCGKSRTERNSTSGTCTCIVPLSRHV
jgi:hypothetical protein